MNLNSSRRLFGACAIAAIVIIPANGTAATKSAPTYHYDHLGNNHDAAITVSVGAGQEFHIIVDRTLPSSFDYEVRGVERYTPSSTPKSAIRVTEAELESKDLPIYYDPAYGGYIVNIRRHPPDAAVTVNTTDGSTVELADVTLMILVDQSDWRYEFAGAFTMSKLHDPVYGLQPSPSGAAGSYVVIEDPDAEDLGTLGVAAFIHVYHHDLPPLAITFGLGISDQNRVTYFVGPTWRWGGHGGLTAGLSVGPVARLPAGIQVGSTTTDANVLANLGTRNDAAFFLAFSYSFFDIGNRLQKPFAGSK